jgi:hypothetical protein
MPWPAPSGRSVAILSSGDTSQACTALVEALAAQFETAAPPDRLVLLGEAHADPKGRLVLTGPLAQDWREDLSRLLSVHGIGKVFFASRRFGEADPLTDSLAAAGYPVALFGAALPDGETHLALTPASTDAEAAEAIIRWLHPA